MAFPLKMELSGVSREGTPGFILVLRNELLVEDMSSCGRRGAMMVLCGRNPSAANHEQWARRCMQDAPRVVSVR